MRDLGAVAFVTGATGGIGSAICQELLDDGCSVVVADLDENAVAARAGTDPRLFGVRLDVTDNVSIESAFDTALEHFGRLDLLVNNAGIGHFVAVEDLSWEEWASVLDVNLGGAFRCLQLAGRHMLSAGRGAIVNIASVTADRAPSRRAAYVSSKAGLVGLTRAAAVEWAPRGVRVNAVGPGWVDVPTLRRMAAAGRLDVRPIEARIPMGRLATPQDVAHLVRFLGSDDASYITGQVVYVDGGLLASIGVD